MSGQPLDYHTSTERGHVSPIFRPRHVQWLRSGLPHWVWQGFLYFPSWWSPFWPMKGEGWRFKGKYGEPCLGQASGGSWASTPPWQPRSLRSWSGACRSVQVGCGQWALWSQSPLATCGLLLQPRFLLPIVLQPRHCASHTSEPTPTPLQLTGLLAWGASLIGASDAQGFTLNASLMFQHPTVPRLVAALAAFVATSDDSPAPEAAPETAVVRHVVSLGTLCMTAQAGGGIGSSMIPDLRGFVNCSF